MIMSRRWPGALAASLFGLLATLPAMAQVEDADVNGDGSVDLLDISLIGSCFETDPAADPRCAPADADGDGVIGFGDLGVVVAHYGETVPVIDETPPVVTFVQPANLAFFGASPVAVSGEVSEPVQLLTVNGVAATLSGQQWSAEVPLVEGNNLLTAVAEDAAGNTGTTSLQVTLDTSPPMVTIESPREGLVTSSPAVTVTGMINDIVVGTVNGSEAQVSVNGAAAAVSNRSYLAADIPLSEGINVITAQGTDRAGNSAVASVAVTFDPSLAQDQIAFVSGNNQRAPIGAELAEPLVVALTDAAGAPVAGETVVFRVTGNNGTLSASPEDVPSIALTTGDQGRATVRWTLGTRAGAGNNRVRASAVGFSGEVLFTATAEPGQPQHIVVDSGNNQVGAAGAALPRPLVAAVTDAGHNRLGGVPVTFTVLRGGGTFGAETSTTVQTDSDGRALATLTLGSQEGFDNNVVAADFAANPGAAATFVASGKAAGDPARTRVSGVVLDNTNQPVPGVTLRIPESGQSAQADEQGQFRIDGVPVGRIHLIADGTTSGRPGVWPTLEYQLVTIAGQDNGIGMPVFLLPLDLPNGLLVSETEGGVLTLPDVPGFSLTVAPGTVTFPGGSRSGLVSVTSVHPDKVPMTPNFGQQPRFIVTIQPAGARFDPPAPITLPNMDGLAPREVTELYSFDHDLGQFVSIGTGTVSADGSLIVADPGVGILKAGWHCGGNPAGIGTCEHECDDGNDCTEDRLVDGKCQHTAAADGTACRDAKTSFMSNGVNISVGDSCRGSCKAGMCEGGSFGIAKVKDGATKALDKIFGADMCGGKLQDPLKKKMRDALKNSGYSFKCQENLRYKGKITRNGMEVEIDQEVCASTGVSGNSTTIGSLGAEEAGCGALSATVLHEMVHGVGGRSGEDVPTGCEKACFNFGSGNPDDCK